jgi:hypothetical protein
MVDVGDEHSGQRVAAGTDSTKQQVISCKYQDNKKQPACELHRRIPLLAFLNSKWRIPQIHSPSPTHFHCFLGVLSGYLEARTSNAAKERTFRGAW